MLRRLTGFPPPPNELVVTPSGRVGSIGILAVYPDTSGLEGKDGVTHRIFSAGKYKAEANPYQPLGDEAAQYMQLEVNRYYSMFTAAVARHREVTQRTVENGFGEGRMVGAQAAVNLGMADRVATLDETIARLMKPANRTSALSAADDRRRRFYLVDDKPNFDSLSAADRERARFYQDNVTKTGLRVEDEARRMRRLYYSES
jgi:ClpP class serine protease